MANKILVVEDESDIREALAYNLKAEGFEVFEAGSGEKALSLVWEVSPDLILLDLMLPDISGLEICRRVRQEKILAKLPIIVLTAKGTEVDRVVGFELGADDYVVKPFSMREVVLRVKAVLARTAVRAVAEQDGYLQRGILTIDLNRHEVSVDGTFCSLTATEFRLINHLAAHPGQAHSRESLLDAVWGTDAFVTPRTVDTHVRRLREKLGPAGKMIDTLRGVGYRFNEEVDR